MSPSPCDDEKLQWAVIDEFSRRVIHNAAVDIWRKNNAKKRNGERAELDIDFIGETEKYPSEHIVSDNRGHNCAVQTEWLYEAMQGLDDNLKEVLILKYWQGLLRSEIAEELCVSEKTITNWKNKAFEFIREYKEKEDDRDIRGP